MYKQVIGALLGAGVVGTGIYVYDGYATTEDRVFTPEESALLVEQVNNAILPVNLLKIQAEVCATRHTALALVLTGQPTLDSARAAANDLVEAYAIETADLCTQIQVSAVAIERANTTTKDYILAHTQEPFEVGGYFVGTGRTFDYTATGDTVIVVVADDDRSKDQNVTSVTIGNEALSLIGTPLVVNTQNHQLRIKAFIGPASKVTQPVKIIGGEAPTYAVLSMTGGKVLGIKSNGAGSTSLSNKTVTVAQEVLPSTVSVAMLSNNGSLTVTTPTGFAIQGSAASKVHSSVFAVRPDTKAGEVNTTATARVYRLGLLQLLVGPKNIDLPEVPTDPTDPTPDPDPDPVPDPDPDPTPTPTPTPIPGTPYVKPAKCPEDFVVSFPPITIQGTAMNPKILDIIETPTGCWGATDFGEIPDKSGRMYGFVLLDGSGNAVPPEGNIMPPPYNWPK